jgi:hypothetical protein
LKRNHSPFFDERRSNDKLRDASSSKGWKPSRHHSRGDPTGDRVAGIFQKLGTDPKTGPGGHHIIDEQDMRRPQIRRDRLLIKQKLGQNGLPLPPISIPLTLKMGPSEEKLWVKISPYFLGDCIS